MEYSLIEKSSPLSPDSGIGAISDATPENEKAENFSRTAEPSLDKPESVLEGSDSACESDVVSVSMQFALAPPSTCNGQLGDQTQNEYTDQLPGIPIRIKQHREQRPLSQELSESDEEISDLPVEALEEEISDHPAEESDIPEAKASPTVTPPPQISEEPSFPPCSVPDGVALPETVSRLTTDEGSEVFVVGTAHFSKESQDDVATTIRLVQPDIIMVELCKSRTAVLQLDEETILNESKSLDFSKMRMIINQHGKVQGILYILLLSVSAHITKQLGMAPGGEFRTAFYEARRSVPNCLIQLGDRPIQITLSRALASLSVWQKIKLMFHILASKEPISKEEVEKCKRKDFIEEMLAEMTGQFPAISEVFVNERDIYLARSLQNAAQPLRSSNSGCIPRVVVGVVGIGHVPGIVANFGKVTEDDIIPIMSIPPPSMSDRVAKLTLKLSFYGLIGFCVYKCVPYSTKTSIFSSIESAVSNVSKYLDK